MRFFILNTLIFILEFSFLSKTTGSFIYEWVWINGCTDVNTEGSYPINDSICNACYPMTRNAACTWTFNGLMYLFGGQHRNGYSEYLSDSWVTEDGTQWELLFGNNSFNDQGEYISYGEVGRPTGRYGSGYFVLSNRMVLFGGYAKVSTSSGYMNDVWATTNGSTWYWIAGSSSLWDLGSFPASYGGIGFPRARRYPTTWVKNDVAYLHAGPERSDLWSTTDLISWIWLGGCSIGTSSIAPKYGLYGQLGFMGHRAYASSWVLNGALYSFGGWSSLGRMNDMFRSNENGTEWYWISGSDIADGYGVYPSYGGYGLPQARSAAMSWTIGDTMFLFGGYCRYSGTLNYYNDMWTTHDGEEWLFVSGCDAGMDNIPFPHSYGMVGYPRAREIANIWIKGDHAYLFGGFTWIVTESGSVQSAKGSNDLWRLDIYLKGD